MERSRVAAGVLGHPAINRSHGGHGAVNRPRGGQRPSISLARQQHPVVYQSSIETVDSEAETIVASHENIHRSIPRYKLYTSTDFRQNLLQRIHNMVINVIKY